MFSWLFNKKLDVNPEVLDDTQTESIILQGFHGEKLPESIVSAIEDYGTRLYQKASGKKSLDDKVKQYFHKLTPTALFFRVESLIAYIRLASEIVSEDFRENYIGYLKSDKPKAKLYRDALETRNPFVAYAHVVSLYKQVRLINFMYQGKIRPNHVLMEQANTINKMIEDIRTELHKAPPQFRFYAHYLNALCAVTCATIYGEPANAKCYDSELALAELKRAYASLIIVESLLENGQYDQELAYASLGRDILAGPQATSIQTLKLWLEQSNYIDEYDKLIGQQLVTAAKAQSTSPVLLIPAQTMPAQAPGVVNSPSRQVSH